MDLSSRASLVSKEAHTLDSAGILRPAEFFYACYSPLSEVERRVEIIRRFIGRDQGKPEAGPAMIQCLIRIFSVIVPTRRRYNPGDRLEVGIVNCSSPWPSNTILPIPSVIAA